MDMYIDGSVIPVPAGKKTQYIQFAKKMAPVFQKYGATRVVECWGDDVPKGKVTDFQGAVKATDGEVVVFSWVEWPDKATRDAGMKKMMADPNMTDETMPFDGKRMIMGGFSALLDDTKVEMKNEVAK